MMDHHTVLSVIQSWQGNFDLASLFVCLIICLGYFLTYLVE
jgi:hypothetical protein